MKYSFRVARILGADVYLHWSMFVAVGIVTWSLGGYLARFSQDTFAAYAAAGAVAVLLFLSVLIHEFSHITVARFYFGMRADSVVLCFLGGLAYIRDPRLLRGEGECRIGIAGPAASLILAGALATLSFLLGPIQGLFAEVLNTLIIINVSMAVFNMLPAIPLDGGMVLRGVLNNSMGDYVRATRVAVKISKGLLELVIMTALVLFIIYQNFSMIWVMFIAWLLYLVAPEEEKRVIGAQAEKGD